jgi:hypothetical protein
MLTGVVNIAVFAAFCCRIGHLLLSDAVFKPCCPIGQLDMWRYGWQKRQDRGKNGKVSGTVLTDSGTIWSVQDAVARGGSAGMTGIRRDMRLFKVLAARGGAATVELIYHKEIGLSRGWP